MSEIKPLNNITDAVVVPEEKGLKHTVLLVEDYPMSQEVARAMLEYCGCRVDIAGNGREAIDAFSRNRYDMIFMDCQMPEMDGYEATALIRDMERKNQGSGAMEHVPIVALTAHDMEGDREQCLRAGMDDFLTKPFDVTKLQLLLDKWLVAGRSGQENMEPSDAETDAESAGNRDRQEEAPPVDQKALDMIASIKPQDAEDVLRKIISLYLDSSLKLMNGIREAVEGNDADTLHRDAHTLKSSSANLGAIVLADMCKELETIGGNKTVEGAPARIRALEHEYGRVREYLKKYV